MEKRIDKWEDRKDVVFSYICLIEVIEKWIQNRWYKKKKKRKEKNEQEQERQKHIKTIQRKREKVRWAQK